MFSAASIATMSACIFLFGLFFSIIMNFQYIIKSAEEGVAITVLFEGDATDEQIKAVSYTHLDVYKRQVTGEGAFKTAYDVMNNWGANHGAISYGHIGADLITLCSILRIPVAMHNVPEEKIFRPASWNAFGMDKEGADYRACQAYGPMYKTIK